MTRGGLLFALVVGCNGALATNGQSGGPGVQPTGLAAAWEAELPTQWPAGCYQASIAADDVDVFVACDNRIHRVPARGGEVSLVAEYDGYHHSLVLDGDDLFWMTSAGELLHTTRHGGAVDVLLTGQSQGMYQATHLVLADGVLYWLVLVQPGFRLVSMAKGGGETHALADWNGGDTFSIDGDWIYYRGEHGVMRIPREGGPSEEMLPLGQSSSLRTVAGETIISYDELGLEESVAGSTSTHALGFPTTFDVASEGATFFTCAGRRETQIVAWERGATELRILQTFDSEQRVLTLVARPSSVFSVRWNASSGQAARFFVHGEPRCDAPASSRPCATRPVGPPDPNAGGIIHLGGG